MCDMESARSDRNVKLREIGFTKRFVRSRFEHKKSNIGLSVCLPKPKITVVTAAIRGPDTNLSPSNGGKFEMLKAAKPGCHGRRLTR